MTVLPRAYERLPRSARADQEVVETDDELLVPVDEELLDAPAPPEDELPEPVDSEPLDLAAAPPSLPLVDALLAEFAEELPEPERESLR